ncbi:type I-B CRISPR-associated endonuclease Cas1b [Paenibacillus sp. 481]|uniref:type I-B CRISPR-associated endonuclease Cas1b n=1 Tax=Paenibacillus sp. 481 TaxID=2835869 RepID=UPI001E55DFD2|nr:type I-B CRISPR-associated endonuclease Cas1b [Paenibacillus sp. 481]UHA72663.1 type I-B CRISPR-associated endonuclease Cas1 [Paenibacillus sp. 481]
MKRDVFMMSGGRLKRKDNTLYFVNEEGLSRPLPIEQTDNIHIFGQVDMNSSMLHLLSSHGVQLHLYNYYGFYDGSFVPRKKQVSGFTVVQQSSHVWDNEKRMYIARQFIQSAVHHMQRNIRKYGAEEEVSSYIGTLSAHAALLDEARSIPQLMGIEGQCRQVYYGSFNCMLKGGWKWEYRSKRPPHDPINAMISFGNSIMYTAVLSEIYKTVLDPTISFLHESSSKRYSLCLDIAEIFKPLITDSIIFNLINNRRIQEKHFDQEDGLVYLSDEGRKRFLAAFDEKMKSTFKHRQLKRNVSYRYLIRLEAYKLIKHMIGDTVYKPFKAWW